MPERAQLRKRIQEPGVRRTGDRSQESGDRRPGARKQETGARSQESGARSQEPGVRSRETGVRSQESGAGITMILFFFCILTPDFSYKSGQIHPRLIKRARLRRLPVFVFS